MSLPQGQLGFKEGDGDRLCLAGRSRKYHGHSLHNRNHRHLIDLSMGLGHHVAEHRAGYTWGGGLPAGTRLEFSFPMFEGNLLMSHLCLNEFFLMNSVTKNFHMG